MLKKETLTVHKKTPTEKKNDKILSHPNISDETLPFIIHCPTTI